MGGFQRLPEILDKRGLDNKVCTLEGSSTTYVLYSSLTCSCSLQPIQSIIEHDEEIKKVQAAIVAGLEKVAGLLKKYLQQWTV